MYYTLKDKESRSPASHFNKCRLLGWSHNCQCWMSTLFGKKKRKRHLLSSESSIELNEKSRADEKLKDDTFQHVNQEGQNEINTDTTKLTIATQLSPWTTFEDLKLSEPLCKACRSLGFHRPTPVQRCMIPFLLQNETQHALCLAATGTGKTAAFVLPMLQKLQADPYGIFGVILTPTRELAKQIHQQILALGTQAYRVQSVLCIGGLDMVHQSCQLDNRPHFCVATPGRLADLLRGPNPPHLKQVRYVVLDEADRLLVNQSGFERDVAEVLIHTTQSKICQTLLFSATLTRSLESIEELAGGGKGRLPLQKFVIEQDVALYGHESHSKKRDVNKEKSQEDHILGSSNLEKVMTADSASSEKENNTNLSSTPKIPSGLKQEYIFMPSRVRDAYLLTVIRTLVRNGGRRRKPDSIVQSKKLKLQSHAHSIDDDDDDGEITKAESAIIFVSTCERCALVSGILHELGVENVALHSLLSQNRRLAALGKFQSQHVRILVATDVASRGLDIPSVDLVVNAELPRTAVNYIHRVGRTARAGRRGRAISLVGEADVALVQSAEKLSGRVLEKCVDVTDDKAITLLGPVTKAARLAKMKLMDIGFDELVKKNRERKERDRKERQRIERRIRRMEVEAKVES
jgi:ATP-dependent RNA helicase DDX49/DBP8